MILIARQVLDDCRVALQMLEEEQDFQRWRIHWAGAVALIRAVGHVLKYANGKTDKNVLKLSDEAHMQWKGNTIQHEIFREFINGERNNILKEYQFNLHPDEEVLVVIRYTLVPHKGGKPVDVDDVVPIGENIYRPLLDSYREGDDARDVYSDAISWWEEQLSAIERAM